MPERQLRRSSSRDAGFTLIELLVVVVILGILIAVAIPLYLKFTQTAYTTSVKADIHMIQLEEQAYSGSDGAAGSYGSTRQLLVANPRLKLSAGSVAAIVWSSSDGFCVGAASSRGPSDPAAPFAAFGFPYKTFFFDSRTGTLSTTLCTTPSGATALDGSYIDDTGGH